MVFVIHLSQFLTHNILLYNFFMSKTKTRELAPIEDEVELAEDVDVDIRASSLEKELAEKYNDDFIKLLKRFSYEISVVGLPIQEACVYVGIDHERLAILIETDPLIKRLIMTKDIEYKRDLMKVLSEKAKTDDKISQWLLERRYPDEFNPRKGSGKNSGDSDDLIGVAVEFIQKSGDNQPLVTEKSGKAFVIKRGNVPDDNREIMNKIGKILN